MRVRKLKAGIISDANVLIDYVNSAPKVLKLICRHVQNIYVALPVLREVGQLSEDDVKKLGIEIIEPSFMQVIEAVSVRENKPSLSGQDAICYVLARDNGWTCLTNDTVLRTHCANNKVECIWGLEIMLYLVSNGIITAKTAYNTALSIQEDNAFIKDKIVEKFKKKLGL
jgi:rRNA-processing protein FCF1